MALGSVLKCCDGAKVAVVSGTTNGAAVLQTNMLKIRVLHLYIAQRSIVMKFTWRSINL